MKSAGIDLAGKENNPTGFSVLKNSRIRANLLYSDGKIVGACKSENPEIIAIDAPLSFPEEGNLREADSELIRNGYRVFPPTFGGMKLLTERGIQLAKELRGLGFYVIEIHPRTSGRILFESDLRSEWISELVDEGWELDLESNDHEIDSALAAFTALLHLKKKTREIGGVDGEIVIPRNRLTAL